MRLLGAGRALLRPCQAQDPVRVPGLDSGSGVQRIGDVLRSRDTCREEEQPVVLLRSGGVVVVGRARIQRWVAVVHSVQLCLFFCQPLTVTRSVMKY